MKDRGRFTPQKDAEGLSSLPNLTFDAACLPWQVIGKPQIPLETRTFGPDKKKKTCSVGSVVTTNAAFKTAFSGLTDSEQRKAKERVCQIADAYLQGVLTPRGVGLWRGNNGHPDIHNVDLGRINDPNGIRVYYIQMHDGLQETFLFVSACRTKQARSVENAFPGYRQVRS